jgi:drug/metabolite transporter (DMT)-like permease
MLLKKRNKVSYKLSTRRVIILLACMSLDFSDNFLFILAYEYSYRAGINFSVIMSMFSFLPLLIAISFYLIFKEKMSKLQIFSMLLSFGSMLLLTFSNHSVFVENQEEDPHKLHPIWSVLMMLSVLG